MQSDLSIPGRKRVNCALRLAIADVLRENDNRWMPLIEIVLEVNRRGLSHTPDGVAVSVQRVRRQTRNYANIFERSSNTVRLREDAWVECIPENSAGASGG